MDILTSKLMKKYQDLFPEDNIKGFLERDLEKIILICEERKKKIILTTCFNSYLNNKEYVKALMLEELAKRILKEIKPFRTKIKIKKGKRKC